MFQVAETLPQEVLDRMHAPQKPSNVPLITPEQLAVADGRKFFFYINKLKNFLNKALKITRHFVRFANQIRYGSCSDESFF